MEKIYIDPGHSNIDPGAVGYETEFRLNEAVSKHQADYLLSNYECEVRVCPPNIDSLAAICKDANDWGANLFVSNHNNAGGGDGFECYVYSKKNVPLGECFAKHVKAAGQNLRSSSVAPGVKISTGLYVLKHTNMPAILNEGAFVDNKKDIQDWNDDAELKKLGVAYAKATAEYMKLEQKNKMAKDIYSLEQFVRDVQKACGATVDGKAGPETLSKTVTISAQKNRKHAVVKAVQKRLYALGYTIVGEADGIAGAKFTDAVTAFQKDNKCWADGEVTAKNKTWRKLLCMS